MSTTTCKHSVFRSWSNRELDGRTSLVQCEVTADDIVIVCSMQWNVPSTRYELRMGHKVLVHTAERVSAEQSTEHYDLHMERASAELALHAALHSVAKDSVGIEYWLDESCARCAERDARAALAALAASEGRAASARAERAERERAAEQRAAIGAELHAAARALVRGEVLTDKQAALLAQRGKPRTSAERKKAALVHAAIERAEREYKHECAVAEREKRREQRAALRAACKSNAQ